MEHVGNGDTNCNWHTWNGPQRFGKESGRSGNRRSSQDRPNYSNAKSDQNTEKSPGDLTRHAVTNTTVKVDQLILARKIFKEWYNNNAKTNNMQLINKYRLCSERCNS